VLVNVYADVHNTCLTYTPAHAWYPKHWSECMHTLRKRCICARACAHMQQYRSFLAMEAIANLSWVLREHRAGYCLPPALLPARQNQSPDAVCLRNPSKSTLAHGVVAAALSHKHHSIIRVGAGLIQFVYGSHSCLAADLTLDNFLFSPWFSRAFSDRHCLESNSTWSFQQSY